jgi:cytochrome b6-f complex iron-sulfur subunit
MAETTNISAGPAPAKPAPAKPAAPVKAPAKAGKDRRGFLYVMFFTWFGIAWTAFTATMIGMTLGTIRFLYPNVLSEPPSKFKVGPPDQYEPEKVTERFKPQGAWIVRHKDDDLGGDIIYALSTTCTHLGCTPNYLEKEGKFKCPCHGSGFYGPAMGDPGINFEGPAPRPLERWAVGVGDDGQVVVDKSRKFQQERGEWTNADSFIKV